MTAIFGAFVAAWQVEQGIIAHLRDWMPDYLPNAHRKAETLLGRTIPDLDLPASYTVVEREPDKWPEDQLPAILVVSLGMPEQPIQDGAGNYRGTFEVALAAVCSTGDEAVTRLLADLYFTVAAQICLDKPSLGGVAENTIFRSARNDQIALERNRTLAATAGNFRVSVANLLTVTGGPSDHLEDPETDPGDFETPLTTDLELEKEEIPT